MKGLPFLMLAAATICALAVSGCSDKTTAGMAQRDRDVRVIVQPLQFSTERTRMEAVGTSRAVQSVALHPATSGEVVAVNFDPGQYVLEGDVLVALDSREEKLAVDLAEVRLQDAERLYERYKKTGNSGAVLPTTLDAARTAYEAAQIELDRARIALDYRTVEAPFDGFVGITDVDAGDRINPDTLITTIDDRSSLLVSFEVPETLIGKLTLQDDVGISTWNDLQPTAHGQVVDIGSRIDPATRTFVARARVDNEDDRLRPGMSFRVALDLAGIPYPVVAETSVQWGAEGAYVWSVVGGHVRRVPVNIVQRQEGVILVDANLGAGDLIVVEGVQRVRDGTEVTYEPASLAETIEQEGNAAAPVSAD